MGLYEDIIDRSRPAWQPPSDAEKFPDLKEAQPAPDDDSWMSSIPQTLLPPKLRKKKEEEQLAGVDASSPAIQRPLALQPGNGAGMIDPAFSGSDQSPFLNPAQRSMQASVGGEPGPQVPMPAPRPPGANAPPPAPPGPPLSLAPPALAHAQADDDEGPPPAAGPKSPTSPYDLPSILDKLKSGFGGIATTLGNNSNTLMALGAGLAGAPTAGIGISRAAAAAIPARAADIKQTTDLQGRAGLTKALVDAGVPVQQAIAAQANPELQKALIQSYITDRGKEVIKLKSKDAWGNEVEVPYIQNKYPKDGEPVLTPAFKSPGGGASNAPGNQNPSGSMSFAPGVTAENFDHTKVGEDYLNQYSPEMKDWVKNYLSGNGMPTGRQASSQMIKAAAMKYGTDVGMPPDDASIGQRKQWSNSLGNTQNGVGLSAKGFQQGLEHFSKLSDNLVKMNLSNGMGLEPVAGVINSAKNLTTAQQELVHKNDVIGQALAREMGNLFAKNGGGVHEAAETKKNVSNSTMSSRSAAGSLEAIDELMQGGLKTLENRRDELFPNGNAPKGSNFLGPAQQAALDHIRSNIAILRGDKAAAAAQPAASAQAPAAPVVPKPGKYVFQNGALVPVQ